MMAFVNEHRKILNALRDIDLRQGSKISTMYEMKNRLEAMKRHPYIESWAKDVKNGKALGFDAINKFLKNFEKNGGIYYFAKDGDEARKIILNIIGDGKLIVKSKSLVGEEIELRQFLEKNGKIVFETDLGEFLVQVTNGRPAHMVTPAVNMTEKNARIALEPYIGKGHKDVTSMVLGVRSFMREKFIDADIGIIGANALAIDTGSLIFITNEGNGALTSILPETVIAITSIEKIYSKLVDAIKEAFVQTIYDGYKSISYLHILNGPFSGKKLYLILLDNGRTDARESFLNETLYCVKCGACQLACPVFKEVDGSWGYIYTAAIGIPWTFITGPKDKAKDLAYFCLGCAKCKEVCPMDINIPELIRSIKKYKN